MPPSRSFAPVLGLLVLACGQPATSSAPASAVAGDGASARLEDLRAQVDAIPAGQTSFDLWVPDEVTMNGAPLAQDAAMALLVDRLLSRRLFPHGSTPGGGGRTYHFRQGPPRIPGVPAPGAPRLVPREIQVGDAYQVHAEHRVSGGSDLLTADLQVTVATVEADAVVLNVLAKSGTRRQPAQALFSDVQFKLTISTGAEPAPSDSPNRFEFLDPQPDEATRATISGLFNTFNFERCVLPRQAHATGEKWTESISTWFFGDVAIAWEAGPVVVHAGGVFARYDAVWRISTQKGAPPTLPVYQVHLNVRTDDGFAGDCNVEDSTLGPDHPTSSNQLTSTRIEG